jgi:hypothetical protein
LRLKLGSGLYLVSYRPAHWWRGMSRPLLRIDFTDSGPLRGVAMQVGPWWIVSLSWETGKS